MSVRARKNKVYWCRRCNVPVLKSELCGLCGGETKALKCTPPCELRPCFSQELDYIRELCNQQFGEGTGEELFPTEALILVNDVPGVDRTEEIMVNGVCVATLSYFLEKRNYNLLLRIEGAQKISKKLKKGYVVLEKDAVPFILKKASVLKPGVHRWAKGLKKGDQCIVLDKEGNVVSVGSVMMEEEEIREAKRGVVVKTRAVRKEEESTKEEKKVIFSSWEDVVKANSGLLKEIEEEAVEFIKEMAARHSNLPLTVSFSGGKDSLATLLLVLEAGLRPPLVFVNTALEFPETVEYVKEIAEKYDLKVVEAKPTRDFWELFHFFGPPAKDYRWCCKTQKLGPVSRLFMEHYPEGVVSFIGQRKFESREREKKGRVWRNPWVPLQIGASPIQEWGSLEVWLYIMWKGAPVNVWYERGLSRIGCWLCPSSDLGNSIFVERFYKEGFQRLKKELHSYAKRKGFGKEWIDYGLWRWKRTPDFVKRNKKLEHFSRALTERKREDAKEIRFHIEKTSLSVDGLYSLSGRLSFSVRLSEIKNLLFMAGEVEDKLAKEGKLKIKRGEMNITLHSDGLVEAEGRTPRALRELIESIKKILMKARDCVNCGICISSCQRHALFFEDGLKLRKERCTHCLNCLSPCPVVDYRRR